MRNFSNKEDIKNIIYYYVSSLQPIDRRRRTNSSHFTGTSCGLVSSLALILRMRESTFKGTVDNRALSFLHRE